MNSILYIQHEQNEKSKRKKNKDISFILLVYGCEEEEWQDASNAILSYMKTKRPMDVCPSGVGDLY